MIIVGFVLLAAAIVIAAALIVQNPATVTVHTFNQSWNVHMRAPPTSKLCKPTARSPGQSGRP
jgi:hypothetical protein